MAKLDIMQHKEVLKQNILAKVGKFKITEYELNQIVDKLNPNNQYTITVITDMSEFKEKMKVIDSEYYYEKGNRATYAGCVENKCERLIGTSKPAKYLTLLKFKDNEPVERNNLLLTSGELHDDISATLITKTLNYIEPISMKRNYSVQYELVMYIPQGGNR